MGKTHWTSDRPDSKTITDGSARRIYNANYRNKYSNGKPGRPEMRSAPPQEDVRSARHRSAVGGSQSTGGALPANGGPGSNGVAALASSRHSFVSPATKEGRWNLSFVGLMFYAFIEYSRLPEMYPIFQLLDLGKVAIILAAVGYLASPRAQSGVRSSSRGIDTAVLVFTIGNLLSSCFASQQTHVWGAFLQAVYYATVYFLLTRILTSFWQIRTFLFLVLLLNLKLAQHTVRSYSMYRSSGMSDMRIIMSGGAGAGVTSFFGNAGDRGLAMTVVWGIVWAWLVGKVEKKRSVRVFLAICFVLFFFAILFCGTRGAVVGAAAIVLAALARSPKRIGAAFLAIVFLLGVWLILPGASKQRFGAAWDWQTDPDTASRITYWGLGLEMFEHNPILGVGPGNFVYLNPFNQVEHSVYVQVLSGLGLVGTTSFLAMLVLFFRLNARTRKLALQTGGGRRSFAYCLAFGLDLGMVGYLTSGAFLSVLYYPHLWILLGLSVALNKCCLNEPREQQAVEEELRQRKFVSAVS